MKVLDGSNGLSVIPQFAKELLPLEKRNMVKSFVDFQPNREVSLVLERSYLKKTLIEKLREEIISSILTDILKSSGEIISTEI